MSKDITELLEEARSRSKDWDKEKFTKYIEGISQEIADSYLDFDYDAGVFWAAIRSTLKSDKNEAIAFLRYDFPLLIILDDLAGQLDDLTNDFGVVVLQVRDMGEKCYSIDPDNIEYIFPNNVWPSEVDPNCFSIGDLWYSTIT
jgi:hypothetical protein